ncbi:septal ring lytic transglycosylase RlpA family protein [Palleronia sp.]|uniref:septal ring lytic transglycosylase RlpA family protein n=1 Tax=Palleronia sp. TaxID=1940284 RepID=UPI0035C7DFC6
MIKLKSMLRPAVAAACLLAMAPIASAHDDTGTTQTLQGMASWYGPGFQGRPTANGEAFDMNDLTAAHRSLPFGTRVRVTNEATDESVVVRINDRGPYAHNRVIDLSKEAAEDIGIVANGVGRVTIEVLASA